MTHDEGNAAEGGSHVTDATSVPPPPAEPGGRGRRGRSSVPGWVLAVDLEGGLVGLLDGLLGGSGGLGELVSSSGGSDFAGCLAFADARPATTTDDEALAAPATAQDAAAVCAGDSVHLGISPDLATARRVAG